MEPGLDVKQYVSWLFMAIAIAWGAMTLYVSSAHFSQLFPAILHEWWTRVVPLVFPSLLVSELIIHSVGLPPPTAGVIRSLASWPVVGATRILDQSSNDPTPESTYRALTWANLYNPWLFSQLWVGIWVDTSLLLAAWLTTRSWPHARRLPTAALRLRSASVDAMNWATILLAELTLARVIQDSSTHWLYQLWIEPTGSSQATTLIGIGAIAWNGLVCVIPLALYAHRRGLSWIRIVKIRTAQAIWAMVLCVPLSLLVPQLRPIGLQILQHLLHVRF